MPPRKAAPSASTSRRTTRGPVGASERDALEEPPAKPRESRQTQTKPKGRKLTTNVYVGGHWYGPAYEDPPADVAARLGDHLFGDE